jgi:hypothetical protein
MSLADWRNNSTITGSDVYLMVGNKLLGTAMSFTLSTSRMKRPVYTFGAVDPLTYGRGVRLHVGTMDAVNLKQSVVRDVLEQYGGGYYYFNPKKSFAYAKGDEAIEGRLKYKIDSDPIEIPGTDYAIYAATPVHLDELPPMDMMLIGGNEAGRIAIMKLHGAEFTNVDWGLTMDDVTAAERISFVCRSFEPWRSIGEDGQFATPVGGNLGDPM